jgi:hypothetical protein
VYRIATEPSTYAKGTRKKQKFHYVQWPLARNWPVICERCGVKGEQHRGLDGKCPLTSDWGHRVKDPLEQWELNLEGAVLDNALAEYWSANTSFYVPRT